MALGSNQLYTDFADANTMQYIINQCIRNINTILPCKIIKADNATFLYDVVPEINFLDTEGRPIVQPTIYSVPSLNVVGNNAGIIIEYAVNDIVLVGFCQRDITTFKNTKKQSNPPTYRIYDLADGIILQSIKFTNPSVYVKITQDAITIKKGDSVGLFDGNQISLKQGTNSEVVLTDTNVTSKFASNNVVIDATGIKATTSGIAEIQAGSIIANATTITATASATATITAPDINLTGNVVVSGTLTVAGAITAADLLAGGISYSSHVHGGVQAGSDKSTNPENP